MQKRPDIADIKPLALEIKVLFQFLSSLFLQFGPLRGLFSAVFFRSRSSLPCGGALTSGPLHYTSLRPPP